jgi:hypothetical protein
MKNLLAFLLLIGFISTVNAEPLCLQRNVQLPLLLSVDVQSATIVPNPTVSLVGALYARNFATIQPVIGAGVKRGDFWIFNINGVPNLKLDANFNPVYPLGWTRVNCE